MSKHDTDTSDQHAAKRRWLNAHEEGITKRWAIAVQMIAIGGAIGTGLFLGAGARLQMAGPALALVYLICGLFSFLFCVHWVSWCYTALPVAVLSLMPVSFWVKSRLCCWLDVLHQLGDDGDC